MMFKMNSQGPAMFLEIYQLFLMMCSDPFQNDLQQK